MVLKAVQIVSIILLSIIAIAESKGGGRGNDGGNGGGSNPPPPKGGSSNKDDDKSSGWSNSVSTTESAAYTSIPGDDYSVTDLDDDDDDDYNPNCWYTDNDGKRRKKKKSKKGKWGKWGWKRKHKKKKYKDDDDDDTGYDITSTMDNDYDVTVTATTEYLDIYSTEEEDCDDDDYTKEPWLSATPYTTDDDEDDDDNDYTSTISPAVDEDVTTSTTTTSTVITIECPENLTEDSPCECFVGVAVDGQCPDRCDISTGECLTPTTTTEEPCPPLGEINDVDTRCECYVVEGADTETELCPARCDDSTGECLTPQALANNNDQAGGFAFGSSNGNTVGGIARLIGGIVLISCCLIIIGCIYWKKRNNKYGNVARIDDVEDGRADDIGDDEGILPISTTTMAKSTKTGLDGEEMEMEEIGHATGKTQTIIQYDSSDEDQVALPQKETNGRALDALIVDGNDNYTK